VGYVQELRALVGNRPLLLPGAEVLILDALGLDDLPADLRRSSRAVLERYRARRAGAAERDGP
jgi:hypothetical protein